MNTVKVGVNGYGIIGKHVADAILLQPDMGSRTWAAS